METSSQPSSRSRSPGNWDIGLLPGLGTEDRDRLMEIGIQTTLELLRRTKTAQQKQVLAAQLQVHPRHVEKWVALADLSRIPAVGCQFCGILLHAGIVSVAQLVQTPLPRLHQQIQKFQIAMTQRQNLCPSLSEVAQWIQQARSLEMRR